MTTRARCSACSWCSPCVDRAGTPGCAFRSPCGQSRTTHCVRTWWAWSMTCCSGRATSTTEPRTPSSCWPSLTPSPATTGRSMSSSRRSVRAMNFLMRARRWFVRRRSRQLRRRCRHRRPLRQRATLRHRRPLRQRTWTPTRWPVVPCWSVRVHTASVGPTVWATNRASRSTVRPGSSLSRSFGRSVRRTLPP